MSKVTRTWSEQRRRTEIDPSRTSQQLGELQRLTGTDHVVCDFSFGRMPPEKAELNMRHFAERVLPVMQSDSAFAGPVLAPERPKERSDDVFAPA